MSVGPTGIADRVIGRDPRAIARAISLVEDEAPEAAALVSRLYASTGRAYLIGVTGPPGAGKSTLVDRLTAALRAEGLLDDRRVADAHVRAASRVKRRGRLRIERELTARGIDRTTAHEALAALSPDDDLAAIRQVLARKRVPATLDQAARRRLFQHLMRRGFSTDAIAKVLGGRDADDDQ